MDIEDFTNEDLIREYYKIIREMEQRKILKGGLK
jgi:hypothetical protein